MAASTTSDLLPCLFLIITHKGNRFQVVPGQKVIIPRAHLLTTRKRAEVLPDGSRALSEGPAGSTEAGSRQGTGFGATSFSALWWPRGA